nr:reverse transcriptase [Tanacetum cinerariifolium]
MVNGDSVRIIKPQLGLRQGEPISPYPFIIVAEFSLTKFLDQSSHAKCGTLVSILNSYCKASGQTVNFEKSSAFFSPNTTSSLRDDICGNLHIHQMDSKAKYLGLPSMFGQKKVEMFGFLLDRVLQKMKDFPGVVIPMNTTSIGKVRKSFRNERNKNQLNIYFLNAPGHVRFGLTLPYASNLLNQKFVTHQSISAMPYRPPTLILPHTLLHIGYPHDSSVKLKYNDAFNNLSAAFGIVTCDSTGLLRYSLGNRCHDMSPIHAKIIAVHYACSPAFNHGCFNAIMKYDSQIAIFLSSLDMPLPWSLAALVDDIRLWAKYMHIRFSWVNRKSNKVAHWVARNAFSSTVGFSWDVSFPDEPPRFRCVICMDV